MGGRSGSSGPTETLVTNTDLPEYVQPYFERLLKRSEADSIQGYQPYGGQRLSYFSPDELQSQAMTRGYANAGTPQAYTDAQARFGAQTPYNAGYTAGTYNPSYQAGSFDAGYDPNLRESQYTAGQTGPKYDPLAYEENLQRFMSPYQQNVIDVEKREARRQSDIMGKGIGDQATGQGGLGGYREGIVQAERERNLAQQMGDIQTRGSQAAFESAQAQLGRERADLLGSAQFGLDRFGAQEGAFQTQEELSQVAYSEGERARQQAALMGLTAQEQEEAARQAQEKYAQTGFQAQETARQAQEKYGQTAYDMSNRYNLAAAEGLQGIGSARQQDVLSRIQALGGIGSQDRALRQASMDMGYDDFQRQRDFSKQQLSDFSGMLRGVPVTPNQTTSTYSQQPGLFQGAISAGLGGLGLYRGMGGGG